VIDPSALPNYANKTAFAAIKADGSIMAWGNSNNGGTSALSENDFSRIGCNMKVLLISVGAEICFIRNTNLIVA
jgi:hypothetical protein